MKTVFLSAYLERVRFCYYGSVLVLLGRLVKMGSGKTRNDGNGNSLVTLAHSAVVAHSTSTLEVAVLFEFCYHSE